MVCQDGQATIEVSKADMALIAAGPELIEATIGAQAVIEMAMLALGRTSWPEEQPEKWKALRDSFEACVAAISKAVQS